VTDTYLHAHADTNLHTHTHKHIQTYTWPDDDDDTFSTSKFLSLLLPSPPPTLSGLRTVYRVYTQQYCPLEKRRVHRTVSVDKILLSFSDFDGVAIYTHTRAINVI